MATVPRSALDHPHHLGVVLADGHAVGDRDHAVGGLELGLEHQGVAAVAPRGARLVPSVTGAICQ